MRELRSEHSQGRNPLRSLLLFVAALVVAVFAYLWLAAPVAGAQAAWSGAQIEYSGKTYTRNNSDAIFDNPGFTVPDGSIIYQYIDTSGGKQEFIYFPDQAAADTGSSASFITYDFDPPATLSNPSQAQTIEVTPRADSPEEAAELEETSSCRVDSIGWFVCPITNFLAEGTDWLFGALSGMLEVRRIELGADTPLFRAWNMMLAVANLAFIAAFLIIIYSQVTSIGLQNYSIKRLLPRLIIAAILVNVSYYICALAVDLSNVTGYALQDVFMGMRDRIVGEEGNGWQTIKWTDITAFILTAGTAAVGGVIAFVAGGAQIGAALILLLPALLGVLLAILVALLVLAARQAIITVLIILAPLAFVAYLLPNTEKWFDKWKDLFLTMLLMFPIFSVLFGGAQLAGTAIIQNAGGSINVVILGMVTQVAPIVITPFLIRFSGSLLGRIAGMVNNPNRGLIDRTRNWSKNEAERRKARRLAKLSENPPKRRQLAGRMTYGLAMRQHRREREMELWKKQSEEGMARANLTNRRLQKIDVELKLANLETENFNQEAQQRFDELRAGNRRMLAIQPENFAVEAMRRAQTADTQGRLLAQQIREAQSKQQINYAEEISHNEAMRHTAGGIAEETGADRALASAIKTIRADYNESAADAREVMKHYKLSGNQVFEHAMGKTVTGEDSSGNRRTFTFENKFMREATIEEIFKIGTVDQVNRIVEISGVETYTDNQGNTISGLKDYESSVSDAMASSNMPAKTVYLGGKIIDDVKSGNIRSPGDLDKSILEYIAKGKFSAQKLAGADAQAIERILLAINRGDRSRLDTDTAAKLPAALNKLRGNAATVLVHDDLKNEITDASAPLLRDLSRGYVPPPEPPGQSS